MKLEITAINHPTPDAITLRLKKPAGFPEVKPGQYGIFNISINNDTFIRNYSFHTSPVVDEDLAITVRSVKEGKISNHLISESSRGMTLELLDVGGNFFINSAADRARHVIMFAGGSGITPIMAMLQTVLHDEPNSHVTLIYANTSFERIIFRKELEALQKTFGDRFNILQVISNRESTPVDFPVYYFGRLSKLVVKKTIKSILESNSLPKEYFSCGPHGLMEVVNESLAALSVDPSVIHQEHFFVPEKADSDEFNSLPAREVIVRLNGFDRLITVNTGESILDASLKSGMKVPHSCKAGACGSCRAQLVSGEVKMKTNHALTETELNTGQVLLCQGFPMNDNVIVQLLKNC